MEDRQELHRNLAQMLKGGVIMDVTTPEQAKVAEQVGACAVMALERMPADIRAPAITAISSPEVEVLSEFNGQPTAVRWRHITAFTWHPELGPA